MTAESVQWIEAEQNNQKHSRPEEVACSPFLRIVLRATERALRTFADRKHQKDQRYFYSDSAAHGNAVNLDFLSAWEAISKEAQQTALTSEAKKEA